MFSFIPSHVRVPTTKWQKQREKGLNCLALDTALKTYSCWTGIMGYYNLCQQEEVSIVPFSGIGFSVSFKGQTESTQFRHLLKLLLQHKSSTNVDLSTVTVKIDVVLDPWEIKHRRLTKKNLLQATHKCILGATAPEHRAVSIMLKPRDLSRSLK